ncbi:MAG TPA: hypothetical protein VMM18_04625 [Gemmatimonadaceae bacterium]|nr:hypothetical protein [Gemmatimonadaceae bacterium]
MTRLPRTRAGRTLRAGSHRRNATPAPIGIALAALLMLLAPEYAAAQDSIQLRGLGPGRPGRILRDALAAPHVLVRGDTGIIALPRDSVFDRTVIVIGAPATVASTVRGDVIVVGGDLWMRPGALVEGRAIALGGGVYQSTLGIALGGRLSVRDRTWVATETEGIVVLEYRELGTTRDRRVGLTGLYGVGLPTYDRVNGLSLPFGVVAELEEPSISVAPSVVFRSHLGAFDPFVEASWAPTRLASARLVAGRRTPTNDGWIRGDVLNSLGALALGRDSRNYYRADRADLTIERLWEGAAIEVEPFVGAVVERAWSAGPSPGAGSAPWSLRKRRDATEGMLRPNPPVAHGRITSAVAGAGGAWDAGGVETRLTIRAEFPFESPSTTGWRQITADGSVGFSTFGAQRLDIIMHSVTTLGDIAPPQRFAYLGGSGTLPTFDLLGFGGDQLLFAEGSYSVPIERLLIRYLGTPQVALRYMIGAAGVDQLPALEQNIGLRLTLALLRLDYTIEPLSGDSDLSLGLTVGR